MNCNSSSVNFQGQCFTNCYSQGIYKKTLYSNFSALHLKKTKLDVTIYYKQPLSKATCLQITSFLNDGA
jgi:hypothetical protein